MKPMGLVFVECAECSDKPGLDDLCLACLSNRSTIEAISRKLVAVDPSKLGELHDEGAWIVSSSKQRWYKKAWLSIRRHALGCPVDYKHIFYTHYRRLISLEFTEEP